jgi:hypothetical protein
LPLIDAESSDEERPYANLLPIVQALVRGGNTQLDGGFVLGPGGWTCHLAKPIDFELVDRSFTLPATIIVSKEYDSIHDERSWTLIAGPGAFKNVTPSEDLP